MHGLNITKVTTKKFLNLLKKSTMIKILNIE